MATVMGTTVVVVFGCMVVSSVRATPSSSEQYDTAAWPPRVIVSVRYSSESV